MIPALGGVGYGQVRELNVTFKVKKIYRSPVVPVVSFEKIQEIHFVTFNYLNLFIYLYISDNLNKIQQGSY